MMTPRDSGLLGMRSKPKSPSRPAFGRTGSQEVKGSIPFSSTNHKCIQANLGGRPVFRLRTLRPALKHPFRAKRVEPNGPLLSIHPGSDQIE